MNFHQIEHRISDYNRRKQRQERWVCAGILAAMAIAVALGWL